MIELVHQYWRDLLYTDGYRFTGLSITLWLLVLSMVIGSALAVPLAIARNSTNRVVAGSVWLFTYVFRGTPLYVQLLIIYTGVYSLHAVQSNVILAAFFRDAMNCTLLAFSLNECAYATEVFAGYIGSTSIGEIEAGRAFGMSRFKLCSRIILPSALRRALPAYSNEVILMLHATTLAFTATIPDILKVARDINSATYASFQAYGIAAILYACIAFALIGTFRRMETRLLAHLRPRSH